MTEQEELERQRSWLKRFPVREMEKREWLEPGQSPAERVRALLQFFGIASFDDWVEQQAALGFRVTQRAKTDRYALQAWVRRGEIEGREIQTAEFDRERFKAVLSQIRGLRREAASVLWPEVERLSADAGVAVVAVRELPMTGASGVARWLSPSKALIQLNLRGRRADIFWFTFFHEAGHVLMHRQRHIFVDFGNDDHDPDEQAANEFAADTLIPPDEWSSFAATASGASAQDVRDFAEHCGISTGIVVGRMQHDELIEFSRLNSLVPRLQWVEA